MSPQLCDVEIVSIVCIICVELIRIWGSDLKGARTLWPLRHLLVSSSFSIHLNGTQFHRLFLLFWLNVFLACPIQAISESKKSIFYKQEPELRRKGSY
ncbi:hypothetical protein BY458DRAFT_143360 [Sporodiniella umbellata]|nr:hypothetical protein BY458DRAFT_143360 [Sporodiniella umbellata]